MFFQCFSVEQPAKFQLNQPEDDEDKKEDADDQAIFDLEYKFIFK